MTEQTRDDPLARLLPTGSVVTPTGSKNGKPPWLDAVQTDSHSTAGAYVLNVCLAAPRTDLGRGERAALGVVGNTADLALGSGGGYYGLTRSALAAVLAIEPTTAEQTLNNLIKLGVLVWDAAKTSEGERLAKIPQPVLDKLG